MGFAGVGPDGSDGISAGTVLADEVAGKSNGTVVRNMRWPVALGGGGCGCFAHGQITERAGRVEGYALLLDGSVFARCRSSGGFGMGHGGGHIDGAAAFAAGATAALPSLTSSGAED